MGFELTSDALRRALSYCPETGIFRWQAKVSIKVVVGEVAGSLKPNGYVAIGLFGRRYAAHRLAWLYVHGVWPKSEIDHRNRIRNDNRIANLRDVTHSQNGFNKPKLKHGVRFCETRQKWLAQIKHNRKVMNLGRYDTFEAATAARQRAEMKFFGEML